MAVLYFHPCAFLRWTPSVKPLYVGLDFLGAFSPSLGYNLTHDVTVIHLDESVPAVVPSALCGGFKPLHLFLRPLHLSLLSLSLQP